MPESIAFTTSDSCERISYKGYWVYTFKIPDPPHWSFAIGYENQQPYAAVWGMADNRDGALSEAKQMIDITLRIG
jgi:hypothetical protein